MKPTLLKYCKRCKYYGAHKKKIAVEDKTTWCNLRYEAFEKTGLKRNGSYLIRFVSGEFNPAFVVPETCPFYLEHTLEESKNVQTSPLSKV